MIAAVYHHYTKIKDRRGLTRASHLTLITMFFNMLEIKAVPILKDNYVWVISTANAEEVLVVDPGEAAPVLGYLAETRLKPAALLITHRHWDHTDGINAIVARYPCPVYGPASPAIPQVTRVLTEGDQPVVAGIPFTIMAIPGHTQEHIAYLHTSANGPWQLFCGDTLFSAGCGRLLGGTAEQLKASLDRFKTLPADTIIHCTHEYTLANLEFASAVMPDNPALERYRERCIALRGNGQSTLPTQLQTELEINPFLRCGFAEVRDAVAAETGPIGDDEQAVFTRLRQWKDRF